jgi:hypothetical protein
MNNNGKVSYKIATSVKTNNDPEIKTKISSDDANKQPKQEIKIGNKKVETGNTHFANNEERKIYKLSIFFLKALLRTIGYDTKFVRTCVMNIPPYVVKNSIDIVHEIGKHKKGYEDLSKLNGLCQGLNDIALKLNENKIQDKVKKFLNRNM